MSGRGLSPSCRRAEYDIDCAVLSRDKLFEGVDYSFLLGRPTEDTSCLTSLDVEECVASPSGTGRKLGTMLLTAQ